MNFLIKSLPIAFIFFLFSLTDCNGTQVGGQASRGFFSGNGGCGFSRVMLKRGNRYIYRDRPAVLEVEKELMSYARKANSLLEKQFGFEPFKIENLESDYVGTGVIRETDIVFSPEYYVDPRSNIKKAERILETKEDESEKAEDYIRDRDRQVRKSFEEEERQINQIQDPDLRATLLERLEDKKQQWERTIRNAYDNKRDFDRYWEDFEDSWEDYEDDIKGLTLITMLHEMGHALGYDHTPEDPENLMNPIAAGDILTGRQINAILCAFHKLGGLAFKL